MNLQKTINKEECLKNKIFHNSKKTKEYKIYIVGEILKTPFLFIGTYAKYFSVLFSLSFTIMVIISLNITPQSSELGDFRLIVVIASMPAFIFSFPFALKVFVDRDDVYLKEAEELAKIQVDVINNFDLINDLIDKKLEKFKRDVNTGTGT